MGILKGVKKNPGERGRIITLGFLLNSLKKFRGFCKKNKAQRWKKKKKRLRTHWKKKDKGGN